MGAFLWQLDSAILRPHQRVVDWMSATIGLDKRSLARWYGICSAFLVYIINLAANYFFGISIKTTGGHSLLVLPIMLMPMVFALTSFAPQHNVRFNLVGFRIIALALFSLVLVQNASTIFTQYVLYAFDVLTFITVYVNTLYFLSCKSPPPKKRFAKLSLKLRAWFAEALAPQGTLVPAKIPVRR